YSTPHGKSSVLRPRDDRSSRARTDTAAAVLHTRPVARRDRRHARSEDGKRQAAALSRPHAAARATGSGTRVRQQRRRQESRDRRRDAWRTRMRTNIPSCRHEPDVTAAIVDGRWGDETLASLREHARACSVCRDVVAVADALGPDPGEAIA